MSVFWISTDLGFYRLVLPREVKVPFYPFFGHPSSDGVTIKMPYGVDVLLHRPASHPIFSYWVG